jgi:hypothetical protein
MIRFEAVASVVMEPDTEGIYILYADHKQALDLLRAFRNSHREYKQPPCIVVGEGDARIDYRCSLCKGVDILEGNEQVITDKDKEIALLREALIRIKSEVGTSTSSWHIANAALEAHNG